MTEVLAEAPVVEITPSAIAQIKFLIARQGNPNLKLRVGVKGGGCSGLSYTMNLVTDQTERDFAFEIDGVTVIVDPKSARFISGSTLDYSTRNLLEGGWLWTNPHAARSCGCGTSFTPR